MSTHMATEGALSGNTSGSFNTNTDKDRFEHFTCTPSLYQPFPSSSPHISAASLVGHHPDIHLFIWRIYYEGEDFIAELNEQYGTGVIPGTELFIEDLVIEAEDLIPPIPTPPSCPSSPLSFMTYNSGEQKQEEAEETLTQCSPCTLHQPNTTPEST